MVSSQALVKLSSPTNSPASPTLMLVSENHSAITNGYAMKRTRMTTPGASSAAARAFSFSSRRLKRDTRMAPPGSAAPAALPGAATTGAFKVRRSAVDLRQLASRPFGRLFRLHLAAGHIRVHDGDDVLVPRLRRPLVGFARVTHQSHLLVRRCPERQHHGVRLPHRMVFPHAGRAGSEALLHDEPLVVVFLRMGPAQELDRALGVLRILHHHVV